MYIVFVCCFINVLASKNWKNILDGGSHLEKKENFNLEELCLEKFHLKPKTDEGDLKVHSIEALKVSSDDINKCGAPEKCIFNISYFIQFLANYTSLIKPCCHLDGEHLTAQVKLKELLDSEYSEELLDILNDFYKECQLCVTNQNSGVSFRNFLWYCLLVVLFYSTVMFWYKKYFEKSKNEISIIKPKINSFIPEEVCKENASNVENFKKIDASNVENFKENDASNVEKKRKENNAVEKDTMSKENKKFNFSLSVQEESVYSNNITGKRSTSFCL